MVDRVGHTFDSIIILDRIKMMYNVAFFPKEINFLMASGFIWLLQSGWCLGQWILLQKQCLEKERPIPTKQDLLDVNMRHNYWWFRQSSFYQHYIFHLVLSFTPQQLRRYPAISLKLVAIWRLTLLKHLGLPDVSIMNIVSLSRILKFSFLW